MGLKHRSGVVALVSGGLDSLVLVQTLVQQQTTVFPLYLRCGLRWESVEWFWLKRWLGHIRQPRVNPLSVLSLPLRSLYGIHWSVHGGGVPSSTSADAAVYLPGRNVFLLSHAALVAARHGVSTVALGILAGNPFGDATPTFLRGFAACLRQALAQPLRILTPLRHRTKAQLIACWPTLPFHMTFSCLQPRGRQHCGRCQKCAERQRAFRQAQVPDPTAYIARQRWNHQ